MLSPVLRLLDEAGSLAAEDPIPARGALALVGVALARAVATRWLAVREPSAVDLAGAVEQLDDHGRRVVAGVAADLLAGRVSP